MIKSLTTILLIFGFVNASAQSILQDYFNGDKDSMVMEAYKLINLPNPTFKPYKPSNSDTASMADMGIEQVYETKDHYFTTRDNKKIFAYNFPKKSRNTIILIHGVKSSAKEYNNMAGLLRESTQTEVFAIDLRGHGKSDGKGGDVDYINQYADDLNDIITAIRKKKPKGKILIAGHSMGGGVVLLQAMLKSKATVDGYILFAPLIGHDSPAFQQPASVNPNDSIEPFMKIHVARIIGLKMFNEIGNHTNDSLPVLFFNLPVNMPSGKYTYRANMSMAPESYSEGLKAIMKPMLVLIGNKDEVFNAEAMKKAVTENSNGEVHIIDGATHNGIRNNPESYVIIKKWFEEL